MPAKKKTTKKTTANTNAVTATIKLVKKTENHGPQLEKLGFEVAKDEAGENWLIQCDGFLDEKFVIEDVDGVVEMVKKVKETHCLVSYRNIKVVTDGKTLWGTRACGALEKLVKGSSCVVAGGEKSTAQSLDELLGL